MRLIDADACREDFMQEVYAELESDPDNVRANRIIDLFDMMPTIESPRDWTPCAEGLPTVKETVLATIEDGFGNDIMFAWYDGENWQDGYKNKIPVIAWQPLPAPYRADDTTGKVKEDA